MPTGAKSKRKATRAKITGDPGSTPPVKTIAKKSRRPAEANVKNSSQLPCFFHDEGVRYLMFSDTEEIAKARFSRVKDDLMQAYLSDVLSFWGKAVNGNQEKIFEQGLKGAVPKGIIKYMLGSVMLKSTAEGEIETESLAAVDGLNQALSRSEFFVNKVDMLAMVSLGEVKLTTLISLVMCSEEAWSMAEMDEGNTLENQMCNVLSIYSFSSQAEVSIYDLVLIGMWRTIVCFFKMCETGNFGDTFLFKEEAVLQASKLCRSLKASGIAAVMKCSVDDVPAKTLDLMRCVVNHTMYYLMMFVYTYIEDFIESKIQQYYRVTELQQDLSVMHDRFCMMLKLMPNMSVQRIDYVMTYGDSMNCMRSFYIHCLVDFVTMGVSATGEIHNLFFYGIDISEDRESNVFRIYSLETLFGDSFRLGPDMLIHGMFKPHWMGGVELERIMQLRCKGSDDAFYYFFPVQKLLVNGSFPVVASFRLDARLFTKAEIDDSSVELFIGREDIWDHLHVRTTSSISLGSLMSENEVCMARIMSNCLEIIIDNPQIVADLFDACKRYTYDRCMVNQGLVDYSLMNLKGECDLANFYKGDVLIDVFENVVNLASGERLGKSIAMFTAHLVQRSFDLVVFEDHSYLQLYIFEDGRHSIDVMQLKTVHLDMHMEPMEMQETVPEERIECSQSSSLELSAPGEIHAPGEAEEDPITPKAKKDDEMTDAETGPPLDEELFDFSEVPKVVTPEEKRYHLKKLVAASILEQVLIIEEFAKMKYEMCIVASELDYWGIRGKTIFADTSLQLRDFIVCFVQVFALRKAGVGIDKDVRKTLVSFPPESIKETFDQIKANCINTGNMPERMKKLADYYLPFFFEC